MIQMHIFLVGMAGAGKTSLGRRLAQNLNRRFVDTDQRVCEMLGMQSVNDVFATLGEPFFRNAETGALIETIDLSDAVDDVHGVELARSRAVAKPDAGKGTGLVALSAEQHRGTAVLRAGIVEALCGMAFTA